MTQQRSPRPVDEFAAAIYGSVRLEEHAEAETLVLHYCDRLTELATLGKHHDQFVAVCTGRPSAATIEPPQKDSELATLFRDARGMLCGEQLATLDLSQIYRHLDCQLQRLSQNLAKVFFQRLERELDAGRVGRFHSFSTKNGRCVLPTNSRGQLFDSPLAVMMSGLDADEQADEDRRSAASVIEFFIDQDIPLATDRDLLRQFRPLQLIAEQTTPPVRQFLRFLSGTKYRQNDDLAHGRFTAIVFFHYIVDSWDDDALSTPSRAPGLQSHWWALLNSNELINHVVAGLVGWAITCTALSICDHRQHRFQIAELKQRVLQLESSTTVVLNEEQHHSGSLKK